MQIQGSALPADGEAVPQAAGLDPELLNAALAALTEKLSGQLVPAATQATDLRPDLKPLLTAKQVAEETGISKTVIYRMLQRGELRSVRVGDGTQCVSRRVPKALVLGFVEEMNAGRATSLAEYSARWSASLPPAQPVPGAVQAVAS